MGVDLAKSVFQVHGVDSHERVQVRKQLMAPALGRPVGQPQRNQMLDFFRQVESPYVVAMEACGSEQRLRQIKGKITLAHMTRVDNGAGHFV